ncbi:MAG TPA: glutathione S-transferase family protein [Geminicoccaceae bacterium]|nr:glutathione S-transferase family protein [Geminicoccaceae bacterium]
MTLFQFPAVWGRNPSPFALKLETWLKLAGIPYQVRETTSFGRAPKGKVPYIEDAGRLIGDSTLIIAHLKATRGIDPDAGLDDRERAEALALQRLFEDHLYFVMVWSRWVDPAGWAETGEALFAVLPGPLRPAARRYARWRVRRMLHQQGLGRHRRDEIYAMGRDDLRAVADYLEERPFFMGERLTGIDAVAYGFLANILLVPVETELKRAAEELPNLVAWVDAMDAGLSDEA